MYYCLSTFCHRYVDGCGLWLMHDILCSVEFKWLFHSKKSLFDFSGLNTAADHLRRVSSIFPLFSLNESDTVIRWKSTLTLKVTSSICKEVPLCSFSDLQYIHLAHTVIYYTHRKIHSMEKNTSPLQPPTPSSSSFPGKSW